MSELKISGFTMLEKALGQPDPKVLMDLFIHGLREQEKIYGPVLTIRVIKYALQFVAQKFGEEPPQNIKGLDQLAEYILSISDKHPTSYNAIMYAEFKTEKELQGQIGAGTRVGVMGTARSIMKNPSFKERGVDVDDAISKFRRTTLDLNFAAREFGYKKNEDGSVDVLWSTCFLVEGCQMSLEDGLLKRPDLRMKCIVGAFLCQFLKTVTGYEWDHDVIESYKPHCITRCYML
nr:hypothetical protein [Candidatus Freyarchaeota archaeon]